MKWIIGVLAIGLLANCSVASRILGIFPMVSKSHWAVGSSIMKALGEAGHEVTVIAPFIMPNSTNTSYRTIFLSGLAEMYEKNMPADIIDNKLLKFPPLALFFISYMGGTLADFVMTHENVQSFMKEGNQFDLVIVESFGTDALLGFGEYFQAPLISVSTSTALKWVNDLVGNPENPSYVPNVFLSFTPQMSLQQRVINYLMAIYEFVLVDWIFTPLQGKMLQNFFPNNKRDLRTVMKEDISLVFVNTHFSLSFPRPYVPNMIEIGGINIDRKVGKLPEDFQTFLDTAKDGVVLFSMGSFLQASDLKPEQRSALISAFSKLKQRVIWRYNMPDADQLPKNIKVSKWLPQKEILAHPNVKVFITHGGMLGTTESTYHGVPMIGIPVFGDQHLNIARAATRGYALNLGLKNITEEAVLWNINEILNNPSYTKKAKELSTIYKDQPRTPQENVVYWSEYVMRHNGAKHMLIEGQNLGFIAYHGVDVFMILVLFAFIFVIIPNYFVFRWVAKKVCGKMCKSKKDKTKLKKK